MEEKETKFRLTLTDQTLARWTTVTAIRLGRALGAHAATTGDVLIITQFTKKLTESSIRDALKPYRVDTTVRIETIK